MLESAVSCYEILVCLLSTAITATTQGGFPVAQLSPPTRSVVTEEIEQRTYFWVETSLIWLEKSGCHDHNSAECYISPMGFEEKSQNSYIPSLSLPID